MMLIIFLYKKSDMFNIYVIIQKLYSLKVITDIQIYSLYPKIVRDDGMKVP